MNSTDIEEQQILKARLYVLESEHRDLDDVIERLSEDKPFDQLQLQRLKKRKLVLKDEMALVRSRILPNIIA
ncbi:MAG: YdcH family protein [Candidatus Puniceispirillaceae bacterium]